MPDVYATIAEADREIQERLADILELRAADPQQRAMLDSYLSEIDFASGARMLEVGCGTGSVSRVLATRPGVEVLGVDPSPVFIAEARRLADGLSNVVFEVGDGRALRQPAGAFDVVVCHTVLCHVPDPQQVLAEAFRVLVAGGVLAVFDGDYATTTVALGERDPLQVCIEAVKADFVNDPWLVRRLPSGLRTAGFDVVSLRSHGYVQTDEPDYMLTLIDRGADALTATGRIGNELGASLKDDARRRAEAREFFGFIGFVSFIARKPD